MIPDRQTWISGYRILWMLVMFDLPVVEKSDRKQATKFRKYLLDYGFHMAQYSVYYRLLDSKEAAETIEKKIARICPANGSVHILTITDKQYENLRVYENRKQKKLKKSEQLTIF